MRMNIILEIRRIGNTQKVSAIDEQTGTEVSFMAPLSAAKIDIQRLARAKLTYVINKKTAES